MCNRGTKLCIQGILFFYKEKHNDEKYLERNSIDYCKC